MKQKTDIKLRDWRGRYSAFIMAACFGKYDSPNATFNELRDYYRIDHNVTRADLIRIGCINPDGTENTSEKWYAYDKAVELYDLVSKRRKERNHIRISRKIVEQQFEAAAKIDTSKVQFMGYRSAVMPDKPRKTKRELLAEYYRIQSQMHAAMSKVCAELAEL